MEIKFILAVIFVLISLYAFAKENLAILPFTGGQGDEGETIAELFSFNDRLNDVFSPIPRTSITQAIEREQGFQMTSGMTDWRTMVAIAQQLGARYVVAGHITSIGNNKLLVISIIDIRNLQQIAGDYQAYTNTLDIRNKLPNMAGNIIQATQRNTDSLPKLAVVPVQFQGGVDQRVADTLTQILSIHLIRSGKYTVYPRTSSLEQVAEEYKIQSAVTAERNIVGMGFGENPNLVLSVVARKLENVNMFNAAIIDLFTGGQIVGRSIDYTDIDEGIRAMEKLTIELTSTAEEIDQRKKEADKQNAKARRKAKWNEVKTEMDEAAENATRTYWEFFSGYVEFGEDIIGGGGSILISGLYFSPFKFTSLGIEPKLYFPSTFPLHGSVTAGLVYPFTKQTKIFADFIVDMGYFADAGLKGIFADWATPCFDVGLFHYIYKDFLDFTIGVSIKYRGTWYDGHYTHSIGIGYIWLSDMERIYK